MVATTTYLMLEEGP